MAAPAQSPATQSAAITVDAQSLAQLAQLLQATLSNDASHRSQATQQLDSLSQRPHYALLVLQLIASEAQAGSAPVDAPTRLSAAIHFKNFIMANWNATSASSGGAVSTEADGPAVIPISDEDRQLVKQHLFDLMLATPLTQIQSQLSHALAIIALSDFPRQWPQLLPALTTRLSQHAKCEREDEWRQMKGLLETANSLFHRYRSATKSDQLWTDIAFVLQHIAEPLTKAWETTLSLAQKHLDDPVKLDAVLQQLHLELNVYHSLISQDISEAFEDRLARWLDPALQLLRMQPNEAANVKRAADEPTSLSIVKADICDVASLYTAAYSDVFAPHLAGYVDAVWTMTISLPADAQFDSLVTQAIRFLISVAKREWNKHMFASPDALRVICERVLVPQFTLRQSDIELFNDDAVEYVRRDMEGSDVDTRRRTASDFLHTLCMHFEQQITDIFKPYLQQQLASYASAPAQQWRQKDCALFMIGSLLARTSTQAKGVTAVNPYIDIDSLLNEHILPELQTARTQKRDDLPILKADCLKFCTQFRQILKPTQLEALLPLACSFLQSQDVVVHTYAAHLIERLLHQRSDTDAVRVVTASQLAPHLTQLFTSLFALLREHDESAENEYVAKCAMRVCCVASAEQLRPAAILNTLLQQLTALMQRVSLNPKSPNFNHYLFETVACLISKLCVPSAASSNESGAAFEAALFPVFQLMLSQESSGTEFGPYIFQLLAQLLEARNSLSPSYIAVFPALLAPMLYESLANTQPLVRLLTAYLLKPQTPEQLLSGANAGRLQGLLGVFQKLLASRRTDLAASLLLQPLMKLPASMLQPFMQPLLSLVLAKLQSKPAARFIQNTIVALSLFMLSSNSCAPLLSAMDAIQPSVFAMLFDKVWCAHTVSACATPVNCMPIITAMADCLLLNASSPFWAASAAESPYTQVWPKGVATLALVISSSTAPTAKPAAEEADDAQLEALFGHSTSASGGQADASYSRLVFAKLTVQAQLALYMPKQIEASLRASNVASANAIVAQVDAQTRQHVQQQLVQFMQANQQTAQQRMQTAQLTNEQSQALQKVFASQ